MRKYFFLIPWLLIMYACANKPIQQAAQNKVVPSSWEFESKSVYTLGEEVNIKAIYKGQLPSLQFEPMKLNIEKKNGNTWESVRSLYCPCEESCPPPAEEMEMGASYSKTYRWNQKEEWCEMQGTQSRVTVSKPVGKGTYRLVILYGTDPANTSNAYCEFNIK